MGQKPGHPHYIFFLYELHVVDSLSSSLHLTFSSAVRSKLPLVGYYVKRLLLYCEDALELGDDSGLSDTSIWVNKRLRLLG